jgi:hypothetical protein
MPTPTQRQAAFERLLGDLARRRAERLGLGYAGTIRKVPPPPLPGERPGATRYFANTVSRDGASAGLVELRGEALAAIRAAERWAETGLGPAPAARRTPKLKRKV